MKSSFQNHFGIEPTVIAKAPGRLEILGNHTDYNEGTVLSVAVDRAMTVAAAKVEGKTCELYDLVINSTKTFDLDKLDNPTKGDWSNYVKGVVQEFQKRGYTVPAFKATLKGTVPLSAGMSSSSSARPPKTTTSARRPVCSTRSPPSWERRTNWSIPTSVPCRSTTCRFPREPPSSSRTAW